jgi:hypothetical protein
VPTPLRPGENRVFRAAKLRDHPVAQGHLIIHFFVTTGATLAETTGAAADAETAAETTGTALAEATGAALTSATGAAEVETTTAEAAASTAGATGADSHPTSARAQQTITFFI